MSAGPFAHWSPLQTLLVWVLGTCVAAVVWYAVFYRATHDEWVLATNEQHVAYRERDDALKARDRARLHAQELDADAAALAATRATSAAPGDDLLVVVAPLASELGLEIDRWRPLADEPAGALLLAPVEVDARGSWSALLELLRRLGALRQVLVVQGLAIRASDGDALELHLVLGELRLRPEATP